MIEVCFTEDMKAVLSGMKGKRLVSYECRKDPFHRVYGNLRMNLEGYSIDLHNDEQVFPFFDIEEDMSCFTCELVEEGVPFIPEVEGKASVFPVDDTVSSVEILKHRINVNHGEYEVVQDMALIVRMENSVLMFARDVWFMELMTVRNDEDFSKVLSMQEIKDTWSDSGEKEVSVEEWKEVL